MFHIIVNENNSNHHDRIKKWIGESESVFLAIAFLKRSGLEPLIDDLSGVLERGGEVTVIVGTDFWLTEPAALDSLYALSSRYTNCTFLMFERSSTSTFHPKYYRFTTPRSLQVIIGSANLTSGGLWGNHEISAAHRQEKTSELTLQTRLVEQQLIGDQRCHPATFDQIRKYESEYHVFHRAIKKAEREAKKAVSKIVALDDNVLRNFLDQYLADESEQANLLQRTSNYHEAKTLLMTAVVANPELTEDQFAKIYGALVGERGGKKLWHSGSVYRSKNTVIPQFKLMCAMINDIAGDLGRSPNDMFRLGIEWIGKIEGIGPNVFTEICNTLEPSKFPVLNNNPTTSLKELGRGSFVAPSQFGPEDYEKYCDVLGRLRDACGFKDYGETDHFLNYVYWKVKGRLDDEAD